MLVAGDNRGWRVDRYHLKDENSGRKGVGFYYIISVVDLYIAFLLNQATCILDCGRFGIWIDSNESLTVDHKFQHRRCIVVTRSKG